MFTCVDDEFASGKATPELGSAQNQNQTQVRGMGQRSFGTGSTGQMSYGTSVGEEAKRGVQQAFYGEK